MADLEGEEYEEPLQWCMSEETMLEYTITARENLDDDTDASVASINSTATGGGRSKVAKVLAQADAKQKALAKQRSGQDKTLPTIHSSDENDSNATKEEDGKSDLESIDDVVAERQHKGDILVPSTPTSTKSSPNSRTIEAKANTSPDSKPSISSRTPLASESPSIKGVNEPQYSKSGLEWKHALDNLVAQNHSLQEQHDAMLVMAEKADVVCEDAIALENDIKQTWKQIEMKKIKISEMEAYMHNKVSDVEGNVQELIALKMQAVELATDFENTRHEVARQILRYGKFVAKLETFEPPVAPRVGSSGSGRASTTGPNAAPSASNGVVTGSAVDRKSRQPNSIRGPTASNDRSSSIVGQMDDTRSERSSSVTRANGITSNAIIANESRVSRERLSTVGRGQYRAEVGGTSDSIGTGSGNSGLVPVKRSRRPENRLSTAN